MCFPSWRWLCSAKRPNAWAVLAISVAWATRSRRRSIKPPGIKLRSAVRSQPSGRAEDGRHGPFSAVRLGVRQRHHKPYINRDSYRTISTAIASAPSELTSRPLKQDLTPYRNVPGRFTRQQWRLLGSEALHQRSNRFGCLAPGAPDGAARPRDSKRCIQRLLRS